jgi:hypothetical protein
VRLHMAHTLRSGREFSPYNLQVTQALPPNASFTLFETGISLQDHLATSIAAASARADQLDVAIDEGDWEIGSDSEDIESPIAQPGWDDMDEPHLVGVLPQPIAGASSPMPPPPATSNIRAAYLKKREAANKRARRQKKHQEHALASGPYDRTPSERHSQAHHTLPPERVAFDAADLRTAGPGAWVGPHRVFEATPPRTARCRGRRPAIIRRLRELHKLLAQGYRYIQWDGKCVQEPFLISP